MRSGQVRYEQALEPLLEPIDSVNQHAENPNNGDVEAVAESILVNGMYNAIKVSRDTKEIIAGNTTWAACKELGAEVIPVIWLDGDETANVRRLLADNKTAARARMDKGLELELLERLSGQDELPGTGYDGQDVEQLRVLAEMTPDLGDFAQWPTLCFQVPPHVKRAFYDLTDAGIGDRERLEILLRLAGWDGSA